MGPESSPSSRERRPWATDGLVIGYLALTAGLCLKIPGSGYLPLVHLAAISTVLAIRRWSATALHQLYAVVLVPILYLELDILSGLAQGATYDATVISWEKKLFGDPMPAEWFSQAVPWLPFSEVLHFCYLTFYPMLFFLALRLFHQRHPKLPTYVWCCTAATFTIYMIQMWFPVQGPRPLMPPLDESLHGPFWTLCHFLCGQGASGAAAFPSGHVTVACTTILGAWHWDQKTYRLVLPLGCGMAMATVYGRFHYAVDALAGAFIGWIFLEFGPCWYRALTGGQAEEG